MTTAIYLFLNISMLCILYYSGQMIYYRNKVFISSSILGILAFTFNEGLRYGRGIDYNVYAAIYYDDYSLYFNEFEPIYSSLLKSFSYLGLDWQFVIIFQSFFLITSGFCVASLFKKEAKLILPLFAVFTQEAENLARWYFAFSVFVICFTLYYQLKHIKKANQYSYIILFVGLLISYNIHKAFIIFPLLAFIFCYVKQPLLNPWVSITLFFLAAFLFDTEYMGNFVNQANVFSRFLGGKYTMYADFSDYYIKGGFAGSTRSSFPALNRLFVMIISVIYGYIICKKAHSSLFVYFYNLYLLSFVTWPICNKIELLLRFNWIFFSSMSIVYAVIICSYCSNSNNYTYSDILKRTISKNIIVTSLLLFSFVYIKTPLYLVDYYKYYIWNRKSNEHYLDINTYYLNKKDIDKN